MSEQADPAQRVAIGLSFGNSYSSIAYTTGVSLTANYYPRETHTDILQEGKAEVIANEDGGAPLTPPSQ